MLISRNARKVLKFLYCLEVQRLDSDRDSRPVLVLCSQNLYKTWNTSEDKNLAPVFANSYISEKVPPDRRDPWTLNVHNFVATEMLTSIKRELYPRQLISALVAVPMGDGYAVWVYFCRSH